MYAQLLFLPAQEIDCGFRLWALSLLRVQIQPLE